MAAGRSPLLRDQRPFVLGVLASGRSPHDGADLSAEVVAPPSRSASSISCVLIVSACGDLLTGLSGAAFNFFHLPPTGRRRSPTTKPAAPVAFVVAIVTSTVTTPCSRRG
jgi:hypothetical protein